MSTITLKQLEALVTRLNKETNSPDTYATRESFGKFKINVGHYHISQAYGGCALYRTDNESGGVNDVTRFGHQTKREVYNFVRGMLEGLAVANENKD